jgi:PAS domain S-box-containing protein
MRCAASWPTAHEPGPAQPASFAVSDARSSPVGAVAAAIEQSPQPIAIVDEDGRPVALNRAAAGLLGVDGLSGLHSDLPSLAGELELEARERLVILTAQSLEAALRAPDEHAESRRQLNQAQAVARIGSWTADLGTRHVRFSDEQYRIYGLEPQSQHVDIETFLSLIDPRDREEMASAVARASRYGEPFRLEHRLAENRNGTRWIEARCETVASDGRVLRMVGTCHDITERKRYEQSLEDSLQEVRASRIRIVSAADEERRRVERDLHDGAQQRLVTLTLTLRLLRTKLLAHAEPEIATALDGIGEELALALAELRDLARGIHPAVLTEQGLALAVESLALRSPLPVTLVGLPDRRLPAQLEIGAYYIVAEALTNAIKHARASSVAISVQTRGQLLLVSISDDGRGGASIGAGSGLRGLADRVAALDGRLTLESPPGGGTILTAELPCG